MPAEVRKRLGIGPGSVLKWDIEDGDRMVVRRAGRFTSEEIYQELFGIRKPEAKSDQELREGIHSYLRKRYARS